MYEFKLPDLGEGIHEGEILKWHVETGSTIKEDAPLVDIETDKAAVTIPSPRGGKVVSQAGKPGETVKVGQVLAVIDDAGGASSAPAPPASSKLETRSAPAPSKPATAAPAPKPSAAPPAIAPTGPVAAAPATRRLARELGLDIRSVPGTGPGGRVTPEDVRGFTGGGAVAAPARGSVPAGAAGPVAAGAISGIPFLELEPMPDFESFGPVEREQVRSIRRKVAKKMATSMIVVPHVCHMDEADVTELEAFRLQARSRLEGQPGGKLSLLPFVVKALVEGLHEFKMFNASLDPFREEIVYKQYYNVGIAVDSGRGLIVPVIKNVADKNLLQISADIEALALKARNSTIDASDLKGGTITITNVGPLGGTGLIPTINYPEVAILGLAKAQPKPVVRDGQIVIRTILPLTLAFDHRVADGADAARLMNFIVRRLSDPIFWLLTA